VLFWRALQLQTVHFRRRTTGIGPNSIKSTEGRPNFGGAIRPELGEGRVRSRPATNSPGAGGAALEASVKGRGGVELAGAVLGGVGRAGTGRGGAG
jgi:hypothetical protein